MTISISRETAQLHAVVVGGLKLLESPLPIRLGRLVTLIGQCGATAPKVEPRLGDVALPAHGMPMAQGTNNDVHQPVDRNVIKRVEHTVVCRLHDERLAKGMVGETRQRHIVALNVNALGKLARGVAHAKHEKRRRKVTYLPIEVVAKPGVEHPQAPRRARHLHGDSRKGTVVYAAQGMVAVVRLHAITLNELQRHRSHAAKRHPYPATREKASARLLLQPQSGEIVGREVNGVAHLQPLGLNGGKHGIGPTKLAATLVFHRGGLQHNLIAKTASH